MQQIQLQDGSILSYEDLPVSQLSLMFRILIPSNKKDFKHGVGQEVWAITNRSWFNYLYNPQHVDKKIPVKVLANSYVYPWINDGTWLPVILRENSKPIAIYEELI